MSIKKLFGNLDKARNYLSDTTDKEAFDAVESGRNLKAIHKKQQTFVPQVNYNLPENFAKYGSAYLYYKSSIERIHDYYPYDGSDAEINEYYNNLLDIDRYILDNLYPRTNGYIHLSQGGWGSQASTEDDYGLPSTLEYITFKGGPGTGSLDTESLSLLSPNAYNNTFQNANIYDEDIYTSAGLPSTYGSGSRESNLKSDFDNGVTVEFWLTTGSANDLDTLKGKTKKQVIFDMWNNAGDSSIDYGRITLYLKGDTTSGSPFRFTIDSGSSTISLNDKEIGSSNVDVDTLSGWKHYAFKFYNTGSDFIAEMYVNGEIDDVNVYNSTVSELNPKSMQGRIGALLTGPRGSDADAGAGKLSGSMDEFRFWKASRTAKEIGDNWLKQVRGGVNSDISNTDLGVYYKFNEGITSASATDSIVLDYGGRICNGIWYGYPGSSARTTDSAIILAGHAKSEYKDPIIRSTHSDVSSLKTTLLNKGSYHDSKNNASILSMVPSWIIEEDESHGDAETSHLRQICHIVGVYFDKLRLQTSAIPKFKHQIYTSASYTPLPFAEHLPQSLGLYTPEIFVDSNVIEKFLNRTITGSFETDLTETKNLIYLNLYNNLTNIFKSKGTEKAIRNVFRAFYINDDLIRLNAYSNNSVYTLDDNLQQTLVNRASINFNNPKNTAGVVFAAVSGTAADNGEAQGFISGSNGVMVAEAGYAFEDIYGFTAEADVIFPKYFTSLDKINRPAQSSLFGMHTAGTASAANLVGTETTWVTNFGPTELGPDAANFQVYAVRDYDKSKNVHFRLTSSYGEYTFPELTSSVFYNVYDNEAWNLSVRLEPVSSSVTTKTDSKFIPVGETIPSLVSGSTGNYTYKLIFRGVNSRLGTIKSSFELTAAIPTSRGKDMLRAPKRIYAGAHRTNFTSSVLSETDVMIAGVRYWAKSLDNISIDQHIVDIDNYGISGSYKHLSPIDLNNTGSYFSQGEIKNFGTLVLNWNFDNVTGSDPVGNFVVEDISSGSKETRENYGWLGNLGGYQHTGVGYGFGTSSTDVVIKDSINAFKFVNPELVVSSDMINILTDDDRVFGLSERQRVPSYYYAFEKSMYNAISEEMLKFFAGVVDFHTVIGAPVNRYRERYKSLEKLREIFFRKVTKVSDVEKFVDYYKWFDDSLAIIVSQLLPASADMVPDVYNTIESHVLERNKYQTKFPTLEAPRSPDPDSAVSTTLGAWYASSVSPSELGTSTDSDTEGGSADSPSSLGRTTVSNTSLNPYFFMSGSELEDISSANRATARPTDRAYSYWLRWAPRNASEISSNNTAVDDNRETLRKIMHSQPRLSSSFSIPKLFTSAGRFYTGSANIYERNFFRRSAMSVDLLRVVRGGVNSGLNNFDKTRNALHPGGPVSITDKSFIPENVLVGFVDDFEELEEYYINDLRPNKKIKRYFKVNSGRNWGDGYGFYNLKSSKILPFNIITPARQDTLPNSGYSRIVNENLILSSAVEIVNVHQDGYGDYNEIPMQGPFTDLSVGGNQHRHIRLNSGSDDYKTRAEAWKILLGSCNDSSLSGAIGLAGADYPWPESNDRSTYPYPYSGSQKAVFYRDFVAKRPVNIKNIKMTTASVDVALTGVLAWGPIGNYTHNYQVVHSVGARNNPRAFINNQPTLPSEVIFETGPGGTSSVPDAVRTHLNTRRDDDSHYNLVSEYNINYLSGAVNNRTIIVGRFAAPGGIAEMSPAYLDFRSGEYSVYNTLNYRNLSVKKPSQGPSGSTAEAIGEGTTGIRVSDISIDPSTGNGKDYGLRSHMARHTARFGRDSLWITGTTAVANGPPQTAGGPGASFDQFPGFHKIHRNKKVRLKITNDGNLSNAPSVTVASASVYDNAFVVHPIPRMTRQYSWFSKAVTGSEIRMYGISTTDSLYSSSAGYLPYFDFLSASSAVPQLTQSLYQNTTRLNTFTLDPINTASTNTLGHHLSESNSSYVNTTFLGATQTTNFLTTSADYLNLLLTRRGDLLYNGNNWTLANLPYHPILRSEHASGTLSVLSLGDKDFSKYNLPPVSYRGRSSYINIGSAGTNASFKASHTNDKILFNDLKLNDLALEEMSLPETSFEKLIKSINEGVNWIWYRQNVFPSVRNDMISISLKRTDYDNKFWRNKESDRRTVGSASFNSFGIKGANGLPNIGQSCWLLDPPDDFSTRTGIGNLEAQLTALRASASAGELQNTYSFIHKGVTLASAVSAKGLSPAALYTRKHTLTTPRSVVSPCGMDIPETGSVPRPLAQFAQAYQIDWGGGEAFFEAGSQAGILSSSDDGTYEFVSAPSVPWYDTYDDFRNDALKYHRGYSVIPEFRISEHIEKFVESGIDNLRNVSDIYQIVGTNINSLSKSFWVDYSNSEFLDYLGVKSLTDLEGKELKLTCTAVKKFNPYNGFYPAQRTQQLVSEFSKSYGNVINTKVTVGGTEYKFSGEEAIQEQGGTLRPLMQSLFAPGVLYNSIKAGIACDYPVLTDPTKMSASYLGAAKPTETNNYAIYPMPGKSGKEFWDYRVPFEAIIYPERYVSHKEIIDCEPHPSVSLNATASMLSTGYNSVYSMAASNFCGGVAEFFLKDSSFTKLESGVINDTVTVDTNKLYFARLVLAPSYKGPKIYSNESGSKGNNTGYGVSGYKIYTSDTFGRKQGPLPQFPISFDKFQKNFTMCSRPSAFGPPVAGQPPVTASIVAAVIKTQPKDSTIGINCHTPPYYDGESWIDIIYDPIKLGTAATPTSEVKIQEIFQSASVVCWRWDPGVVTGSSDASPILISSFLDESYTSAEDFLMAGPNINSNVMQATASINLWGLEPAYKQTKDSFGNLKDLTNEAVGYKWVIQPKWETPHMNFSDVGVHPITNAAGNLKLPDNFASASVPRCIWQQYGVIDPDPSRGVFLKLVGPDGCRDWLETHYDVITNNTAYNGFNASSNGQHMYKNMKSLVDLTGFNTGETSKRIGELKDEITIKEAVVAIPYVIKAIDNVSLSQSKVNTSERKEFISIPTQRTTAVFEKGTAKDSLQSAGESIRKMMQKMNRYVLPPQVDWINNENIDPFVMYIFEFDYTLDKNDLSNIWQNVAPTQTGNYRKVNIQESSTAHELMDTELLSEANLLENENLGWMLFKVKQRSQANYYDFVAPQYGETVPKFHGTIIDSSKTSKFSSDNSDAGYPIAFNWPYDYLSFVELVKMDVEVLLKPSEETEEQQLITDMEKQAISRDVEEPTQSKTDGKRSSQNSKSKTMSRSANNKKQTKRTSKSKSNSKKGGNY